MQWNAINKDKRKGKSWVGEFHGFVLVSHRPAGFQFFSKLGSALDQIKNAGPMKESAVMKIFLVHMPYAVCDESWWIPLAQQKFLMECLLSLKLETSLKHQEWSLSILLTEYCRWNPNPAVSRTTETPFKKGRGTMPTSLPQAFGTNWRWRSRQAELSPTNHGGFDMILVQWSNQNLVIWIMGVVTSQNGTRGYNMIFCHLEVSLDSF